MAIEGADAITQSQKNYKLLRGPLLVYAILAGLYTSYSTNRWNWFSWHPIAMTLAFVAFAGNAALIKKMGGYDNTKTHGTLMFLSVLLGLFGWYVIYTNKEMYGKPHLYTLHGKLGAAACLGYLGLGVVGTIALNPDFGILKTNKIVRFAHKWGGRALTALAWYVCVLGESHFDWIYHV